MLFARMNQGGQDGGVAAPATPAAPASVAAPANNAPAQPAITDIVGGLKIPGQSNTPYTSTLSTNAAQLSQTAATPNAETPQDPLTAVLEQTRSSLFGSVAEPTPMPPQYAPAPVYAPQPAQTAPVADPAIAEQIEALRAENARLKQAVHSDRAREYRLPDHLRTALGANSPDKAPQVQGLEYMLGTVAESVETRIRAEYEQKFAELEERLAPVQETLEQQVARQQREQAEQRATVAVETAIHPLMADPRVQWLFDEKNGGNPVVVMFGQQLGKFANDCVNGRGVLEENGKSYAVPPGPINPQVLRHYAAQLVQHYSQWVPSSAQAPTPSAIDGAQATAGSGVRSVGNMQGAPQGVSLRDALTDGARGRLLRN